MKMSREAGAGCGGHPGAGESETQECVPKLPPQTVVMISPDSSQRRTSVVLLAMRQEYFTAHVTLQVWLNTWKDRQVEALSRNKKMNTWLRRWGDTVSHQVMFQPIQIHSGWTFQNSFPAWFLSSLLCFIPHSECSLYPLLLLSWPPVAWKNATCLLGSEHSSWPPPWRTRSSRYLIYTWYLPRSSALNTYTRKYFSLYLDCL